MANKIQIRRGLQADLPTLDLAEMGYTTDTKRIYIGDPPNGNIMINIANYDFELINGADGYLAFFIGPNKLEGNENLFWDRINNRLGIGTKTPTHSLTVDGYITPALDGYYELGTANLRWKAVHVGPNSFHISSTSAETITPYDWHLSIDQEPGNEGNLMIMQGNTPYIIIDPVSAEVSFPTTTQLTSFGPIKIFETTAPLYETGSGKIYVSSADHRLHFINNTGTDTAVGATASGVAGAVQFSNGSGDLSSEDANLHWDATNDRLGIGTSSPAYSLDVNGDAKISGNLINPALKAALDGYGAGGHARQHALNSTADHTSSISSDYLMIADANGLPAQSWATQTQLKTAIDGYAAGTPPAGSSGYIQYNSGSNTFAGESNLFWDATNDRLGIGTSSPSYQLHATKDSNTDVYSGFVNPNTGNSASYRVFIGTSGHQLYLVSFGANYSGTLTGEAAANATGIYPVSASKLFIGTYSSAPVHIMTNNTKAITIDTNQYVGIGNTGPTSLLSVGSSSGSVSTPTNIKLDNTYCTTDFTKLKFYLFSNAPEYYGFGVGSSSNLYIRAGNATTGKIQLVTSNTERVVLDKDGNVGIGTSSPSDLLNVYTTTAWNGITLQEDATGHASGSQFTFLRTRSGGAASNNDTIGALGFLIKNSSGTAISVAGTSGYANVVTAGSESGSIYWQTRNAGTWDHRMLLRYDGLLGIGTISPTSMLSVHGGVSIGAGYSDTYAAPSNGMIVEGSVGIGTNSPTAGMALQLGGPIRGHNTGAIVVDTGYGTLSLGPNSTTYCHIVTDRGQFYFNKQITIDGALNAYSTNDLIFETGDSERMRIYNATGHVYIESGKLGIWTNSPNSEIDINHAIRLGQTYSDRTPTIVASYADIGGLSFVGYNPTILTNAYWNGTNLKYMMGYSAYRLHHNLGDTKFYIQSAPVGSGGNNITFIDAIVIDPTGKVGIANSSPTSALDVTGDLEVTGNIINTALKTALDGYAVGTGLPAGALDGYAKVPDIGAAYDGYVAFFTDHDRNIAGNTDLYWKRTSNALGVGVTAPLARLHVKSKINHVAKFENNWEVDDSQTTYISVAGKWCDAQFGCHAGYAAMMWSNGANPIIKFDWNNSYLMFYDNAANERMRMKGASLGIGTTDPAVRFHVKYDGASVLAKFENKTSGTSGILIESQYGSGFFGMDSNYVTIKHNNSENIFQYNGNSQAMIFSTNGGVEQMRIHGTSGFVGIGNASPGYKLDIEGSATNTNAKFGSSFPIYMVAPWPTVAFNAYYNSGWKFGKGSTAHYGAKIDMSPTTGTLSIATSGTSGAADGTITFTDKVSVLTDGKVGIGTTSPSEALDVIGNIEVSGNIINTALKTALDGYGTSGDTRSHALNSASDHTSSISPNYLMIADSNGLPAQGWATQTQLKTAIDGYGAGTSPAGADGYVQYNNGGVFGGAPSLYYDDINARVGIGTSSPSSTLTVFGGATIDYGWETITYRGTGTSGQAQIFALTYNTTQDMVDTFGVLQGYYIIDSSTVSNCIAQIGAMRSGADNSGAIILNTSNAGTMSTKMTILPDGSVGIGATTPTAKLMVQGTGDATARVLIKSTNADSNSGIAMANDARTYLIQLQGADSDKLYFYDSTASAVRMCIDSSGNVGIGTAAPTSGTRLEVSDTVNAGTRFDVSNPSYTTSSYAGFRMIMTNASDLGNIGTYQWGKTYSGSIAGLSRSNASEISAWQSTRFIIGSGNNSAPLYFITNGTLAATIDASQRVGIGTSSPGGLLHVSGPTHPVTVLERTSSDTNTYLAALQIMHKSSADMVDNFGSSIQFAVTDSGTATGIATIGAQRSGADGAGRLVFSTATTGSSVEKMTILPNGNVGIGTASPSVMLDVVGQIQASSATWPTAQIERTTATNNGYMGALKLKATNSSDMIDGCGALISFCIRDTAAVDNEIARVGALRSGADNSGALRFDVANAGTMTEAARILSNGFMGIGTTTPSSALDVIGDLEVSGGIINSALKTALDGYGTSGHTRSHALNSTSDHTSSISSNYLIIADSNGLPSQGWITQTQLKTAIDGYGSGLSGGSANKVAYWTGSNTLSYNSNFHWDNTNTRLGIGVTSPATVLHVRDASSGATPQSGSILTVESSGSTYMSLLGSSGGSRSIFFGDSSRSIAGGICYNDSGGNDFQFRTNGNTTRMTIDGSGRVGIGTTGPNSTLGVNGNVAIGSFYAQSAPANSLIISDYLGIGITTPAAGTDLYVCKTTTSAVGILARNDGTGSGSEASIAAFVNNSGYIQMFQMPPSSSRTFFGADNSQTSLLIARSPSTALFVGTEAASPLYFGTNNLRRMTIDSAGLIGIGTTNPSSALDIIGDIEISGGILNAALKTALDGYGTSVHSRSHALNSVSDHTSSISPDYLMIADANGLPTQSWVTQAQLKTAIDGYSTGGPGAQDAPKYTITTSKTGNYSASLGEVVRCDPSSAGFTVTLPTASSGTGQTIIVKNTTSSNNTITIQGTGGELIDSQSSVGIAEAYRSITFVSYGSEWGRI